MGSPTKITPLKAAEKFCYPLQYGCGKLTDIILFISRAHFCIFTLKAPRRAINPKNLFLGLKSDAIVEDGTTIPKNKCTFNLMSYTPDKYIIMYVEGNLAFSPTCNQIWTYKDTVRQLRMLFTVLGKKAVNHFKLMSLRN